MFKDKKMSEFCDQMKDFIDIKKSLYLDYEDIEKEIAYNCPKFENDVVSD